MPIIDWCTMIFYSKILSIRNPNGVNILAGPGKSAKQKNVKGNFFSFVMVSKELRLF